MELINTEIVVVGAGPGGYAAAFHAADKGKQVVMAERDARLGGVCLNHGCIPSKTLIHATNLMDEAARSGKRGITYDAPRVNLEKMRAWKDSIIEKLEKGIRELARMRKVRIMAGRGHFEDAKTLRVETAEGQKYVRFANAIIATGSEAALPKAFDLGNPRVMTSTGALALEEVPETLLVVGGGYIGMELGAVYAKLGSRVTLVEALDTILAGADPDLIKPVLNKAQKTIRDLRAAVKVKEMATAGRQIKVLLDEKGKETTELFDRVLTAVGRAPNTNDLGLENTRVKTDGKGFIQVNHEQQTDEKGIYAIGDAAGGALLAHKAAKEARIAVETICGETTRAENLIIPAVVFTDPELAWCGLTEKEAEERGRKIRAAKFPWTASGRALSFDRPDGFTKLIIEPETERILGAGICGYNAGELISEGVLAIEMGATARDLAEVIHPHPTLSETLMECAEAYFGEATHILARKPSME